MRKSVNQNCYEKLADLNSKQNTRVASPPE